MAGEEGARWERQLMTASNGSRTLFASHKLQNALIIHHSSPIWSNGGSIGGTTSCNIEATWHCGINRVIQITVMIIATIKNCRPHRSRDIVYLQLQQKLHRCWWSLRVRHSICGKSVRPLAMSLFRHSCRRCQSCHKYHLFRKSPAET